MSIANRFLGGRLALLFLIGGILSACSALGGLAGQANEAPPLAARPTPSRTSSPSAPLTHTRAPTTTNTPEGSFTPTDSKSPTITLTPTISQTPSPSPIPSPTIPSNSTMACIPENTLRQEGHVVSITDGDTIRVEIDGTVYKLRYIGMDTAEVGQAFADAASAKNSDLVAGKSVTLVKDVSETDRYGRLLRYIIADGVFVNYELVRLGLAAPLTYPPDVACADMFVSAAATARLAQVGMWAAAPTSGAAGGGNCDLSYPDVCIPPPLPDLDCGDIPYRRFRVLPPDPHRFDGNHDGIGCQS